MNPVLILRMLSDSTLHINIKKIHDDRVVYNTAVDKLLMQHLQKLHGSFNQCCIDHMQFPSKFEKKLLYILYYNDIIQ